MEKVIKHIPERHYIMPAEECELIRVSDLAEYLKDRKMLENFVFKPVVYYNKDGDGFEIYWSNDDSYSEELANMTLCKSMKTDVITGVKIWGIKKRMGLVEVKPGDV